VQNAATATDDPVAWCVSLYVCLSRGSAVQKGRIDPSGEYWDPKWHIIPVVDGGPDPQRRNILYILYYRNIARIRCGLCQIILASC